MAPRPTTSDRPALVPIRDRLTDLGPLLGPSATGSLWAWSEAEAGPGGLKAHGARAWLDALDLPTHPHRRSPVLTAATTGSHHLSGLARLAAARGRPLAAILLPQPPHPHALANARISLPLLQASWTLTRWSELPPARARALAELEAQHGHEAVWLPPGGGGEVWTAALSEACEQVVRRAAELQVERIVLAAGSGTTTAALWLALGRLGLELPLLAVSAVPRAALSEAELARRCRPRAGSDGRPLPTLIVDPSGTPYGRESPAAQRARDQAQALGLPLDPFYSARALAWCLAEHDGGRLRGASLLVCGNEAPPAQS